MFEHGARGFTKVSACVGGRVSDHTDARKRGRSRTKTTLVALLIWNLGLAILQLHFQYRYKLARESSLFFRSTMGPARENNSDNTVDLECARLNHQQLSASERARDLVKGSKLTTRKRGRSRTTTISVVLLHFIGRRFSFTFRLGTFEFGARGFTVVSACAGGVVIELKDTHGANIVVACSLSESLSCVSPTKNSGFVSAPRQQANGSVFVDLRGFAVGSVYAGGLVTSRVDTHDFTFFIAWVLPSGHHLG